MLKHVNIVSNQYIVHIDHEIVLIQVCEYSEYLTRKLVEEYNKQKLEANVNKTKCLGRKMVRYLILENVQHIKYSDTQKYLYVELTDHRTLRGLFKKYADCLNCAARVGFTSIRFVSLGSYRSAD